MIGTMTDWASTEDGSSGFRKQACTAVFARPSSTDHSILIVSCKNKDIFYESKMSI